VTRGAAERRSGRGNRISSSGAATNRMLALFAYEMTMEMPFLDKHSMNLVSEAGRRRILSPFSLCSAPKSDNFLIYVAATHWKITLIIPNYFLVNLISFAHF